MDGKPLRIASARVDATGWVIFEGLSREAVSTIRAEAARAFPPATYSGLKRDVLLLFAAPRRGRARSGRHRLAARYRLRSAISCAAAEEIGRGRTVDLAGDASRRTRSAASPRPSTAMSQRVARQGGDAAAASPVLALGLPHDGRAGSPRPRRRRPSPAFTGAERVWFHLYDRNTNRLEAAVAEPGTSPRSSPRN